METLHYDPEMSMKLKNTTAIKVTLRESQGDDNATPSIPLVRESFA